MKRFLIAYTWLSGQRFDNMVVELKSVPQFDGEVQELEKNLSLGIQVVTDNAHDLKIISISPLQ